jgi:hypothetical protein
MQPTRKMDRRLTKTAYLRYLKCPQEFWLEYHEPLLFASSISLESDHLFRQGNEVQKLVRSLAQFQPDETRTVDFERTFQTADLSARSDVVVTDAATGEMSIYEIKASGSVKDDHLNDLAFQKMVAEEAGSRVAHTFVITMHLEYVRQGEIETERLFVIHDMTEPVAALVEATQQQASAARAYLQSEFTPSLIEYAKSNHARKHEFDCVAIRAHFPDLPDYTVFHVPRIYKPKLISLLEKDIIDLREIPADFQLSDTQREYIAAATCGEIKIDRAEIRDRITSWQYPLQFLDYETFQYAIPQFDGVSPFQQMCFQYSLHTIDSPGGEPRHSEYLACADEANPPRALAEHLKNAMSDGIGTVFVWFESFEKTRNSEMAERFPGFKDFFEEVNAKTVDLMKIFSERLYVHPEFKGRSSIKKVLPVLCPNLPSYSELGIKEGLTASISWYRAVKWEQMAEAERLGIFNDLLEYCELDTRAMVEIFNVLAAL